MIEAERLIMIVSNVTTVAPENIKGKRRFPEMTQAKHMCAYFLRSHLKLTLKASGNHLDISHPMCIKAVKNVKNWLSLPNHYKKENRAIRLIRQAIEEEENNAGIYDLKGCPINKISISNATLENQK